MGIAMNGKRRKHWVRKGRNRGPCSCCTRSGYMDNYNGGYKKEKSCQIIDEAFWKMGEWKQRKRRNLKNTKILREK